MVTSYLVSGTRAGFVRLWAIFYILYVTLSRMIVLYSWCRVNWGTNLFVVFIM